MAEKVLMKGNEALAEAALRAGCRFFFGYPITPQTELAAYMSKRMPKVGGTFLQAESEIAAINMVYGASAAGARVMTSSSSPGISLKGEGLPAVVERDLGAEGRSVDEVECAHASGSHEACASPAFLVEALAAVPDDVVSVEVGGGRKPIMFKTLSGSYRQAVMPVVLPKGR